MHIRDKVSIKRDHDSNLTLKSLKDNIADSIQQEETKSVAAMQTDIYFKVGWLRPCLGWKLFAPITSGRISIQSDDSKLIVNYKLSFEHLIIIATVMTALMSVSLLLTSRTFAETPVRLIFILPIWLWLVCGNIAITAFRFPRFIRTCAAEVEKQFYINTKKEIV